CSMRVRVMRADNIELRLNTAHVTACRQYGARMVLRPAGRRPADLLGRRIGGCRPGLLRPPVALSELRLRAGAGPRSRTPRAFARNWPSWPGVPRTTRNAGGEGSAGQQQRVLVELASAEAGTKHGVSPHGITR